MWKLIIYKNVLNLKPIFFIVLFLPLSLFSQTDTVKQHNPEAVVQYSIQCPLYSVNTPADLSLPQDTKYRSRIGLGFKYYPFTKWYASYIISFSQEGGGTIQQRTNANYLKNSILWGFSSSHSRLIIFEMFCGIDLNLLLNAKLKYSYSNESENVSDFFHKFNLSFPFGFGLKTKLFNDIYFNCDFFVSMSPYSISKEPYIRTAQIIFPAFQFGISKFIK